jgi:UDP:flavonoid glycosyltransferase YjiC (YdhE family)
MRVVLSTYGGRGDVEPLAGLAEPRRRADRRVDPSTPETRARAAAVAGTISTDGATVAATLLLDAVSRERPPVTA